MRCITLIFLIISLNSFSAEGLNTKWSTFHQRHDQNIKRVLNLISYKSETGQELVSRFEKKAIEMGKTVDEVIIASEGSFTDSTILRSFKEHSPLEVLYNTKVRINLNKELPTYYAVLDLAHEMVHFLKRQNLNPYIDQFSVADFIHNSIEGDGGEVDAFMLECIIDREVFGKNRYLREKCEKSQVDGRVSKEQVTKEFYKLGNYFKVLSDELLKSGINVSESFPYLSRTEPSFISSVHSMPYPLAGYFEFKMIKGVACKNEKRRYQYIFSSPQREGFSKRALDNLKVDYNRKCSGFNNFEL